MHNLNPAPPKDLELSHPIASMWRPTLCEIVRAFAEHDYGLTRGIPCVAPVQSTLAEHIRTYIADYGKTLIPLPEETWKSSLAQWMGTHWEVLVDLWTAESGQSDMVLHVDVFEAKGIFQFRIHLVYVP